MAPRMRTMLGGAALVVVVALVAAGCGDDDDGDDEAGGAAPAAVRIEAHATDFAFDPATWTVPAGAEVTIEFENEGTQEHEWVIVEQGSEIATEAEFEEDVVLFEVEAIAPDEEVEETFTVDEAGTYQVICALPGHFAAGMEGELTVE